MSAQPSVVRKLSPAALPRRNHDALNRLLRVFHERRPLAVLQGSGYEVANLLVSAVSERVESDVDILRLTDPSQNPHQCMNEIVQSIGFETTGLALSDLQQILKMFLAYQKTHCRRTILFVEKAHEAGGWTLAMLDRQVAKELVNKCGLLVVLAGESSLKNRIADSEMKALQEFSDAPIRCAMFDLEETRHYIHRYVEADSRGPVSEVFEFDAITRLHDISAGVPETINQLLGECLESAGGAPVSLTLVEHVADALRLTSLPDDLALTIPAVSRRGWLVARLGREVITRIPIETEKLVIGRNSGCDIRLCAPVVSREHAVILSLQDGVRITDLGSTNGTFVNDDRVDNFLLDAAARITIGDYRIDFTPVGVA